MGGREEGGREVWGEGADSVMAGGSLPTWLIVGGLTPKIINAATLLFEVARTNLLW